MAAAITDALRGFEAARHRVLLVLVAIQVLDGRSIGEVARAWSVSRELASRWSRRAPACGNETATPQRGVPDDARVLSAKATPDPSPGRHDTVADLTGEPPFR